MTQSLDREALQLHFIDCLKRVAGERDKAAFGLIFDHFAPRIRAFSFAREPGAALMADELAQIVLIKVWEKAHTYKAQHASVSTWIFTIARNSYIDMQRSNGRYTTEIDPEQLWHEQEDEMADPFLAVEQKRSEQVIKEAFEHLSHEQREALVKVFIEGKTHQECSSELNIPLGTTKSRIRLALQKLKLLVRRPE